MITIIDDHLFTTVIWAIVGVALTTFALWVALGGQVEELLGGLARPVSTSHPCVGRDPRSGPWHSNRSRPPAPSCIR